jgi:hypothetical protein
VILNDVIAALAARYTTAADPIPVFDVPTPNVVNNALFVAVGSNGEDEDGATVDLVPSDLGPGTWLDETGAVVCSAWSQAGGTDLEARRDEAASLAEACLAATRADRTLGGLLQGSGRAEVSGLSYRLVQTPKGPFCRFTWTVSYGHLSS